MTMATYIKSRGLTVPAVAQKMGVRRQHIYSYGLGGRLPTGATMIKIAEAMTALGAPTTAADVLMAFAVKPVEPAEPADESKTAEG